MADTNPFTGNHASPELVRRRVSGSGRAQLSLVEHSLCPLDPAASLVEHLVHETSYQYTDRNRHTKKASVRVLCPFGLSATDELTLWGLLALTFCQNDPQPEFQATPHYCLRQLGVISDSSKKGGKQYQNFRETIRRLSRVIYENTAFYDPVRGEHRDVAFGLLKYSMPLAADSPRTWRFIWDQQFFEFCAATQGSFAFDLETYRGLDPASRRLFVLLQKIFWRQQSSPSFDVLHLAVDVLGFSRTMEMRDLKARIVRSVHQLSQAEVVALPLGCRQPQDLFVKKGVGSYAISFQRGAYFDRVHTGCFPLPESPLLEPLRSIGFEEGAIRRLLRDYSPRLLSEWADITLAARERHGSQFFKKSPAAYFLNNVQHAAKGKRTPPDWWRRLRVDEMKQQLELPIDSVQREQDDAGKAFEAYLATEARESFMEVMKDLTEKLMTAGRDQTDAKEKAATMARAHFRNRFRQEHPQWAGVVGGHMNLTHGN